MKKVLLFLVPVFLIFSCNNDDDSTVEPLPNINGLAFARSGNGFTTTYDNIRSTLANNENIGIVAEVDHAANAASANLDLPPTRVIMFGNPTLGTPLMQENQLAGLDLPQKVLVYEENDAVYATYNTIEYLARRHDLNIESTELQSINEALSNLVENATNVVPTLPDDGMVANKEGIITVASNNKPFSTTYSDLRSAIESNENLTIIAELDHQENGASVGKVIRPTKLIVFGNPNLGTPMMQNARSLAIDLPQKMLVWRDETGVINISYNDPAYIAQRHDQRGNEEIITTISETLAALSEAAAN